MSLQLLIQKKIMEIFIEWTKEIVKNKTGKNISIDGKAIKSATDKIVFPILYQRLLEK